MKYSCTFCDYYSDNKSNYEKHLLTAKHICLMNNTKKVAIVFNCDSCDYTTSRKPDYKKHLTTAKHKSCKSCKKTSIKVATIELENSTKDLNMTSVMCLIKENQEFKNMMIEQQKQVLDIQKQLVEMSKESKITTNNNNNNNNNNTTNNNNQFNLNFFLNETCKNAINFSDFIENIKVSYDDLENNAKLGFVNGMTKLIVDNLKQLELNDRPIHCTDVKRETIYVKEDDQWEKEKSKEVIQKGIQEITCKNMNQLMEWREENPEYNDMDSELSELSIGMQQHSMAGGKRDEFYTKIIKNMAKETVIEKNSNSSIL
jgi:hypothetical protein